MIISTTLQSHSFRSAINENYSSNKDLKKKCRIYESMIRGGSHLDGNNH